MSIPRGITHDMPALFRCHVGSEPQAMAHHLDGYNPMGLLTGKGTSKRHELFYFGGPNRGAVRIDDMKIIFFDRPWGWRGEKTTTDMFTLVNLPGARSSARRKCAVSRLTPAPAWRRRAPDPLIRILVRPI